MRKESPLILLKVLKSVLASLILRIKEVLIAILLYADDIVLIAEKKQELQKLLDIV